MAYRLKNGVFTVRCRQPGCPFNTQIEIESMLIGETENDVELEATKIARDKATTTHDAVYGNNHYLQKPVIRKIAGSYEPFGSRT